MFRKYCVLIYVTLFYLSCKTIQSANKYNGPNSSILIVDCQNLNFLKEGDTLLATKLKNGDTLNFSFSAIPGSGYGWDYIDAKDSLRSTKLLSATIKDSVFMDNQHIRYYLYNFIIVENSL